MKSMPAPRKDHRLIELPAAVLFDAAGTLIRLREPVGTTYVRHALGFGLSLGFSTELCERVDRSFGSAFSRHQPLWVPATSTPRMKELERKWWLQIVTETFQGIAEIRDFVGFFDSLYNLYSGAGAWALEPGSSEVLEQLQRRSVRAAVVSNFDSRLPVVLETLGIAQLISEIVFSSGTGAAKPDSEIFNLALQRLSVGPADCWHVGDSPRDDYEGATKAGIEPLLYDPSGQHGDSEWRTISHLEEILTRGLG